MSLAFTGSRNPGLCWFVTTGNYPEARASPAMLREINRILTGKEKKRGWLIAFLDLFIALLDIAFLAWLMLLVNHYTGSRPEHLPPAARWLPQVSVPLFLILYLAKNLGAYAVAGLTHQFFASVSTRLSRGQLLAYFRGSPDHFTRTDASVFVRRVSQQPVEFSTYILANAQAVISQSLLAAFTIAALIVYHPALFVILFVILMPPVAWLGWVLRNKLREVRQGTRSAAERAIQFLRESLDGYTEANVYRRIGFFTRRYENEARKLNQHIARQQTLQALPARLLEASAIAGFFLLAAILRQMGGSGLIDWLTIGVFLGAIYKIMPAMVRILNGTGQMKTYAFILPDLVPGHEAAVEGESGEPHGRHRAKPAASTDRIQRLTVTQLRFRHPGGRELKIGFNVKAGDLVALTGQSGSGKTTLLQLLAGFLKPGSGSIRNNYAVAGAKPPLPGDTGVAYVQQQPFVIHDSLRKNISLSDRDDDAEKTDRLARSCGLGPLLAALREGTDQQVTENGRNISGGQRQRIMLARALYRDPSLLLLDEPFSQLDEAAEAEMMRLLAGVAATGVIIIIATHSAAAAAMCHSIISLDEAVYA